MLKARHKVVDNKEVVKDAITEVDKTIDEVIEFQLGKILREVKSKKITHPETPCLDESIHLIEHDLKNYKKKCIDKRKYEAGDCYFEYRINRKSNRFHVFKKRNNGEYVSTRNYQEA